MIFIFKKIDRFNTSIRLPVVLAVDSAALEKCSTVLDESEYDIAKYIVNRLFQDIQNDRNLYYSVEICFIDNRETKRTDFFGIDECIFNEVEICHSVKKEDMIHFVYEKLFQRINTLEEVEINYIAPLVIFIGNKDFEITNQDDYRDEHVDTMIINIGKTNWNPIENTNIKTFSVATMAIAEKFDIRKIIQYIFDEHRLRSYLYKKKKFHNYCGALREDLIFENDAPSSEGIDKDEIMKSIRADMEAILADLAEE